VSAGLLIVAGALLIIGSAAGALARVYLPRAKGSHHGPRQPGRLIPPHPRAMFGPGIEGPSVPLPPTELRR
jgi:hypothetical protein